MTNIGGTYARLEEHEKMNTWCTCGHLLELHCMPGYSDIFNLDTTYCELSSHREAPDVVEALPKSLRCVCKQFTEMTGHEVAEGIRTGKLTKELTQEKLGIVAVVKLKHLENL
jgi:hypothetical protein